MTVAKFCCANCDLPLRKRVMGKDDDVSDWFFGYGSLVNHLTHTARPIKTARLAGWRREWVLTSQRPVAFLSVRAATGHIDGLIARVPERDWSALDAREAAYRRQPVQAQTETGTASVALCQVPADNRAPGVGHILLSYLDVVIEGYAQHFGADGVAQFFATTDGWDCPVLDDRAAPLYPRHRDVGAQVRALVDAALSDLGAAIIVGALDTPECPR